MSVPEFSSFFLLVLKLAASKSQVSVAEMREYCKDFFNLTPEDVSEMLNSGRQTRFANRVQWAKLKGLCPNMSLKNLIFCFLTLY